MTDRADLAQGTELADYRVEELIGRGGMGEVYRALDTRLHRPVALKLLAERFADDERFRDRLLRESRLAAGLDHPNVVPVYDAGEIHGQLFIAMRYVDGTDLKTLLRRDGSLPPGRAIALADQIGSALDAAHRRGLVHRDVKPSNVLVDSQDGREHCYLADFGLTQSAADRVVSDGDLMGTLDYVAPEQIRGDEIDGRADVYALGCLLYETLVGEVPFTHASEIATIYAHLEEEPPAASSRRPELPPEVDTVLRRAMAKDPAARPATCGELVDDTRAALGLEADAATRRRWPWIVTAIVALLAAAAATAVALTTGGGVAEPAGGELVQIDPNAGSVTARYDVSAHPGVIATSANRVWTGDFREGALWRLDPGTGELKRIPAAGQPRDLTSLDDKVYVASDGAELFTGSVNRYDAPTGTRERSLETLSCSIGGGEGVVWSCGSPSINRLSTGPGALEIVETVTLPFQEPISAGTARVTHRDVAVGFGSVWVLGDGIDRRLWKLDRETGAVQAEVELPAIARTVAVGEGAVWVTAPLDDLVLRVEPASAEVTHSLPTGRGTSGVAAGAGSIWVANTLDGTVSRIDPETVEVAEVIDVGGRPREVAVGAGGVWVSNDAR